MSKLKNSTPFQLHPISMRVSQPQYQSLLVLRGETGIPVQEHVRRAVDLYLRQMAANARRRLASQPRKAG